MVFFTLPVLSVCELFLGDLVTQFPGVRIGGIGLGFRLRHSNMDLSGPHKTHVGNRLLFVKTGPHDLVRLLELVDLDHALRRLRLIVERLRGDGDFDRLLVGLPVVRRQRCLQGSVAHVDALLGGAGLAGGVGHIGSDGVMESRLILLGNRQVGLGRELDLEAAVHFRDGRAVGDLLAGGGDRDPPAAPPPPRGIAHLAAPHASGPWPRRWLRRCRRSPCRTCSPCR